MASKFDFQESNNKLRSDKRKSESSEDPFSKDDTDRLIKFRSDSRASFAAQGS